MEHYVLLSILPRWAEAILDGEKKWEYRRVLPNVAAGSKIVLYASGEMRAIVGEFVVEKILQEDVERLIIHTFQETPHNIGDIKSYFSNLKTGSAFRVCKPIRYDKPITLKEIRTVVPDFFPPQNFIYLREEDMRTNKILRLLPNNTIVPRQKSLFF
ncbi:ASCH domain-containing protein [Candidatus Marsarchaeota archaeon]|jgi:predicted transcriptional regulator|nr:ASCH domain-containing protein [Candidatus Marsarchaeota archaeon]MCL5092507.1 ASCH domain-containing protein [Candidatus Marsarchaeota archaeon]